MSKWLTIAQAAKRVDRCERTIRRWMDGEMQSQHQLVREDVLVAFEVKMRARRGRPRKSVKSVQAL